ncbi:DUF6916 family protein [Azospirillum sp. B506]|uniref:DUF6916 family protein n=1 Tax=Azospirillum sp. B506 TaxID=137721 RepID=UPI000345B455|nr:hypothetical protein [Azospirillum sp. B506]
MLTYEAAKTVEGSAFTIQAGTGPTLPLTLVEVRLGRSRTPPPGLPQPFSLYLKGTPRVMCPQGTYVLENQTLGRLEVFVVPVGDDPETGEFLYQVIFN